jgi:hypothetical protein
MCNHADETTAKVNYSGSTGVSYPQEPQAQEVPAFGRGGMGSIGRSVFTNENIISHHTPDHVQLLKIGTIRAAALNFMNAIDANCPPSADASDAKRKVREAMMTANAAIVLNGLV